MIDIREASATIANAAATSDSVELALGQLMGLIFPASMTGTTMTFTMCQTLSGTYVGVKDVGGAADYSVTVTSSKYVPLDPRIFAGCKYVKLVSGSSETGAKVITCVIRPVM